MFYALGKIADKAASPLYGLTESGFAGAVPPISAFVANHGGSAGDYDLFTLADDNADAIRVRNGDEWIISWTGDAISGISFTDYDALKWLRFSTSKSSIEANNRDTALISAEVWAADKSAVDTTYSDIVDVDIGAPNRSGLKMRFNFVKGRASKFFKTNTSGLWHFPANVRKVNSLKIDTDYKVTVNAVM